MMDNLLWTRFCEPFKGTWLDTARITTTPQIFSYADGIEDTDKEYSISFDVPGVEAKDIKILHKDNEVHISYERKDRNSLSASFSHTLPSTVDISTCDPVLKNGVLKITFKKGKSAESLPIKVREG